MVASRGSAGRALRLTHRMSPSLILIRVTRGLAGLLGSHSVFAQLIEPGGKLDVKSPPVGWFARNSTLSNSRRQTGFSDVSNFLFAARDFTGTTYNSGITSNYDIIKEPP